ncbi:MAG TPA: addiction module toxin RelE [Deltaproteobacteria bacterium]|nr:addiction module toxin RelE [Deltaproteobacteria bacterium]
MASRDMRKGKSGGFRVIYLVLEREKEVHLLTLYPKSERENIDAAEINEILIKTGLLS